LKRNSLKTVMDAGFECSRDSIAGPERSGILPEWAPHPEPPGYVVTGVQEALQRAKLSLRDSWIAA
jgi:hypothetical protein